MSETKKKDFIGFTLDFRAIGNLAAQDPTALRDILAGIQDACNGRQLPLTTKLGSSNVNGAEGAAARWYGIYVATVRGMNSGTPGLFHRNNTRGGKGDRIQMRFRKQKTQSAGTMQATSNSGAMGQLSALASIISQATNNGSNTAAVIRQLLAATQKQQQKPNLAAQLQQLVGRL